MGGADLPMDVELLLEEGVDRRVQAKWESRRPRYPETAIKVEAAGALSEEIDLAAT